MPTDRAIDKLRKAFSINEKSSYPIYKNGELILKVYWTPLTIADRDSINATLMKANKGQEEGNLDFALQVIINKAEDQEGKKLFAEAFLSFFSTDSKSLGNLDLNSNSCLVLG